MTRPIPIALLLLLFSLSPALSETFDISDASIEVPAPAGYVLVDEEMPAVYRFSQELADPVNVQLGYYISEEEAETARQGEIPRLTRTFMLKVGKGLLEDTRSREDFVEVKDSIRDAQENLMEKVEEVADASMAETSAGLSEAFNTEAVFNVAGVVPLEPHAETEDLLATSMYIKYDHIVAGVERKDVVAATYVTANVAGKVLFFYAYAPEDQLDWTREAARQWVDASLAANDAPPAVSALSRSFEVNQFLWLAIVIGFLVAVLSGVRYVIKKRAIGHAG
jgi:hypothetical protein